MSRYKVMLALFYLGIALGLLSILAAMYLSGWSDVGRGVGALLLIPTLWVAKRAAQYRQKAKHLRPPPPGSSLVVYLRSFQFDGRSFGAPVTLPGGVSIHMSSAEKIIITPFAKTCEVIAVGRPGEKLPELGCRRVYFTDAEWQDGVTEFVKKASIVVINLTFAGSVVWELKCARNWLGPHQLLVFLGIQLLRDKQDLLRSIPALDTLRELFFENGIPTELDKALLIRFESGWRPVLVSPQIRARRLDIDAARLISATMTQALGQLPANWRRPLTQKEWQTLRVGGTESTNAV